LACLVTLQAGSATANAATAKRSARRAAALFTACRIRGLG